MNSEDLPLGVRRAMLRPTTLQQPLVRQQLTGAPGLADRAIAAPQTGPGSVLTPERTVEPQNEGGALNAKDENYDHHTDHTRPTPKLEHDPCNAPLAAGKGEETHSGRVSIRIVSVRKRLLDPDNLAAKWHLDSLRYIGIIRDDTAEEISLQVSQRKAAKGEEERTEITIVYPDSQQ